MHTICALFCLWFRMKIKGLRLNFRWMICIAHFNTKFVSELSIFKDSVSGHVPFRWEQILRMLCSRDSPMVCFVNPMLSLPFWRGIFPILAALKFSNTLYVVKFFSNHIILRLSLCCCGRWPKWSGFSGWLKQRYTIRHNSPDAWTFIYHSYYQFNLSFLSRVRHSVVFSAQSRVKFSSVYRNVVWARTWWSYFWLPPPRTHFVTQCEISHFACPDTSDLSLKGMWCF